jgi:hypothetical protein
MSEFRVVYRRHGDVLVKSHIPAWWSALPGDIAVGPDGLPDFGMSAPPPEAAPPRPNEASQGVGKAEDVKDSGKGGEAAPALTPFEAGMRRAEIMGATVAHHRPALAALLAADHSIPVADAIRRLANAPIETALPDYSVEITDAPAASFGSSFEARPLTHAESVEQFKRVAQAALDERATFTIRV